MASTRDTLRRFACREDGSVALIFALCIMGIFGSVALAVDFGRAHSVSSKVRSALDAAGLAGAKLLNEDSATDAEVEAYAKKYFDTHVAQMGVTGATFSNFAAVPDQSASTVKVSVDVAVKPAFPK